MCGYRHPIYAVMEGKHLPMNIKLSIYRARKNDVLDLEWIAECRVPKLLRTLFGLEGIAEANEILLELVHHF